MIATITLSWAELMLGATAGAVRRVTSIEKGYDKNKHAAKSDWQTEIDGACAEMAFAKFLGVYWTAGNRTFKQADVGTWHVRSTLHRGGHLIVRPNDKAACDRGARFVLVIADAPRFEIIGWCTLEDACTVEHWRENENGWWVPQGRLNGLVKLGRPAPETIAA